MEVSMRAFPGVVLCCLITVLAVSRPALAQAAADHEDERHTIRELLDEVRLLRQVLQTSSLVSVRANILLARHQAQQERIGQIERQLTEARTSARDSEAQVSQFADYATQAEESLATENDPAKRAEK